MTQAAPPPPGAFLPASPPVVPAGAGRTAWVDIAKGLGIILVVYGHVLRGNIDLAAYPGWAVQDRVIYAFHMPLFFVLSGLFLARSLARGRAAFLRDRGIQLVYPYLLWSLITAGLELAMSAYVNSPLGLRDVLLIPVVPIEQYWFLYVLFLCQVVLAVAGPRPAMVALVAVVAMAGYGRVALGPATPLLQYLPFVVWGMLGSALALRHIGRSLALDAALAATGLLALGGVLTHSLPPLLATQAAGLAGTIAVIGLAALCQRVGALARPLVTLGQASMAVYVSHTIASAGMRIALRLFGVAPDSPLSLVACVLAGLGGPLVLWYLAGAQPWGRWVGLGALPAARPEPRAAAAG